MATYDLHQHLWPEAFVTALRARTTAPFLAQNDLVTSEGRFAIDLTAHQPDVRIRALDRDEVDVAVLSLQSTLGLELLDEGERLELEDHWAAGIGDIVSAAKGRFLAFAPTQPRDGFAGISLGASSLLDLDRVGQVLDDAATRGCVVFVRRSGSCSRSSREVRPSSSSASRIGVSTCARRSTRIRSSTSRPSGGARWSSSSRPLACISSCTGAIRPSSTRARHLMLSAGSEML